MVKHIKRQEIEFSPLGGCEEWLIKVSLNANDDDPLLGTIKMPYATVQDLPQDVQNKLPESAQRIYMAAFNSATADGMNDEAASRTAWNSVKNSFEEGHDGQWHHRPEGGTTPGDNPTGTMAQA